MTHGIQIKYFQNPLSNIKTISMNFWEIFSRKCNNRKKICDMRGNEWK